MTTAPPSRTFEVRHVQLARAAFAALAALMITFSSDHSAAVGLSVFSGFAIATALVLFAAAWLVYPATRRWPVVLLGAATIIAGMAGGLAPLRTVAGFFAIVVSWAIVAGLLEAVAGIRALRGPRRARTGEVAAWSDGSAPLAPAPRSESRDALVVGVLTVILGIALLFVPTGYALEYTIAEANQTFTLTGITIGVGVFGGYAAIVAVYLGIAGFSPRPAPAVEASEPENIKDPA